MLEERDIAVQAAEETVHRKMKLRIVIVNRPEQFAHFDLSSQLLADLAAERLLPTLAGFDLATGELPPVFPLAIAALGGEDTSFVIADDGCDGSHKLFCQIGGKGTKKNARVQEKKKKMIIKIPLCGNDNNYK